MTARATKGTRRRRGRRLQPCIFDFAPKNLRRNSRGVLAIDLSPCTLPGAERLPRGTVSQPGVLQAHGNASRDAAQFEHDPASNSKLISSIGSIGPRCLSRAPGTTGGSLEPGLFWYREDRPPPG
jgi:hypothetical protein